MYSRHFAQGGYPCDILCHEFFETIDIEKLKLGKVIPEFIPKKIENFKPYSSINPVKAYYGDQSIFEEFSKIH